MVFERAEVSPRRGGFRCRRRGGEKVVKIGGALRGRGLGLKSGRFCLGREKRRIENCSFFGFGQKSRF